MILGKEHLSTCGHVLRCRRTPTQRVYRCLFPLICTVMVSLGPADGWAEPPAKRSFTMEWDAPAECPTGREVTALLDQFLGRPLVSPLGDGITISARLTGSDDHWNVNLSIHEGGEPRQRQLGPQPTCVDATNAVALVIAIAIDADAVESTEFALAASSRIGSAPSEPGATSNGEVAPNENPTLDPEVPPNPEPTPPENDENPLAADNEKPPPAEDTSDRGQPSRSRRNRVDSRPPGRGILGATAGFNWGTMPGTGAGLSLHAGAMWSRLRIGADGRYFFATTAQLGEASVELFSWTLAPWVCPVFGRRSVQGMICGAIELGQLVATPYGVDDPQPSADVWFAWRVAPTLSWAFVRRVALVAAFEVYGPFVRNRYEIGGAGPIHEGRWVGVRGWIGLELRLP